MISSHFRRVSNVLDPTTILRILVNRSVQLVIRLSRFVSLPTAKINSVKNHVNSQPVYGSLAGSVSLCSRTNDERAK